MPEALKRLIDMIHFLPWIGEKTAAKLAFFLLKANKAYVINFARAMNDLHEKVHECSLCHGLTDKDSTTCKICNDQKRSTREICVVEDYLDLLSIERTGIFHWAYHVLGWVISPIQWITPDKLNFESLFSRILENNIDELILAMNPNIEWEATALYIMEHIPRKVTITRLSKWLPHAGSIEYADEITLLSAFRWRG
jgi:recombination protein RecR